MVGMVGSNSVQIPEQRMEEGVFSHLLGREAGMDVLDRAAHTHCDPYCRGHCVSRLGLGLAEMLGKTKLM